MFSSANRLIAGKQVISSQDDDVTSTQLYVAIEKIIFSEPVILMWLYKIHHFLLTFHKVL